METSGTAAAEGDRDVVAPWTTSSTGREENEMNNSDHQEDDQDDDDDDDWEEWDGSSPFWVHCVAGSLAGVVEHAAVYPLDTVRTHMQVCAACVQRMQRNSSNLIKQQHKVNPLLANRLLVPRQQQKHQLPTGMWQTICSLVQHEPAALSGASMRGGGGGPSAIGTAAAEAAAAADYSVRSAALGWTRLFRGVQTVLMGCIPAHALYFSSYETVKALTKDDRGRVTAYGSSLAGAAAVLGHDCIMTPLDTLKQRMQLGYHGGEGVLHALRAIIHREGYRALYRSFSVTLATNVPYGMVMVTTNEYSKQVLGAQWDHHGIGGHHHYSQHHHSLRTILVSSSLAGLLASAVTTPLDRIKTALQTQELTPICYLQKEPPKHCPLTASAASAAARANGTVVLRHDTWRSAAGHIYQTEGAAGFVRGMLPRVLSHAPAVAISWTTYETVKHHILSTQCCC